MVIPSRPSKKRADLQNRLRHLPLLLILSSGLVILFLSLPSFVFHPLPIVAQSNSDNSDTAEEIYVVQRGETASAIARRYGITLSALMSRNGLVNADFIYIGQRLIIPAPQASPMPTAEDRDVEEQTAAPTITATVVSATATALSPTATATPVVVTELTTIYTVQAGDTLSAIARRFETNVADLLRRNGMANANFVYVGQRLEVPVPMRENTDDDGRGSAANPIRINFAAGATAASVEGILTFPQRVCYVVDALAGQEISVALASGGDLANFSVSAVNSSVNGGVPLKRLENEDRTWQYTLPVSGDYLICVAIPEGAAAYTLTVTIPVSCTSVTQEIEIVDWETVIQNDPKLSHEQIGEDRYVTVIDAASDVSGIPQLDQIVYGDFDGDCLEEAGVPLFSGGTAGNIGFLLYDFADDNTTTGSTPSLAAWGGGYKLLLLADSGLLIVSNALYNGWEPNCCPSGVSYDGYRLKDNTLVLVSSDSEGYVEMRVETVNHFYELLQNRDFDAAYGFFAPEFQATNPQDTWQAGYADTMSFVATATADPDSVNRVLVELEVNERLSSSATRIRHFRGYWDLVWSGATPGWLLQDGQFVAVP